MVIHYGANHCTAVLQIRVLIRVLVLFKRVGIRLTSSLSQLVLVESRPWAFNFRLHCCNMEEMERGVLFSVSIYGTNFPAIERRKAKQGSKESWQNMRADLEIVKFAISELLLKTSLFSALKAILGPWSKIFNLLFAERRRQRVGESANCY